MYQPHNTNQAFYQQLYLSFWLLYKYDSLSPEPTVVIQSLKQFF